MRNPFLSLIILSLLFFSCSSSPDVKDKQKDIIKLLELTEAASIALQLLDNMMPQLKKMAPAVPDKYWEALKDEIDPDELISLIVPIYDKYYTHDDILKLIKFYQSPIGKKVIASQSDILDESMIVGELWGKRIAERILKKLQKDGYLNI